MSLNAMRALFHSRGLGLVILIIVTGAMLVTAYTGIGAILTHNSSVPAAAQANTPASVVATVDGIPISRQQYDQAYENTKQRDQMMGQPSQGIWSASQDRMTALQGIISQAEQVKVAENAGITASDADVDKARDQQLAPLITQLGLSPNASIDQINDALQANNSPTVGQLFPDSILREQAIVDNYQDMVKKQIVATDSAVQQYYRQVHTRHILISNKSRPDAQAKALAQLCIDKIKGGANFADLVTQYTDDKGTKAKGGDDGFISETTGYVPEFLKAALALNAGQVTPEPVMSPQYGYFVIQAVAVKEALPADYSKNQAKYDQQVAQSLQNQYMQSALTAVTNGATIVVNDPLLRAYYDMSQQATYQSPTISADFKKALATADYSTKGEIYAQLAVIDERNKDTKDEVADLQQALLSTEDPQLRMMLGDIYRKQGDNKDALLQYQTASTGAFNTPYVHLQLEQDFKQMGQPQLVASEAAWMKKYMAQQKAAQSPPGGIPGGMPINIPAKAIAVKASPAKTVSVKTTAPKPAPAKPTD
jgi:parvulin-like peptidyl-prolyl isomerase